MNLVESFSYLSKKLSHISSPVITEDKGHLDHPEDLVFLGASDGAERALRAIMATAQNPNTVTIKWDGYPALIFGHDTAGQFSIMDKHMFNKKDGSGRNVYSAEDFIKYDLDRDVVRSELHQIITDIWPGLQKASFGSAGYYWGDLLFSKPLEEKNSLYTFRANPNGITYTVEAKSSLGKLITGKKAGIAVHQYLSPDAATTDSAVTLNGTIGKLKNNSDVAIVPSAMPVTPNIELSSTLVNGVKKAIAKYGADVDKLMTTAPQARNTFNGLFTTFINKCIISGDLDNLKPRFLEYAATRPMLSEPMRKKLFGYDTKNADGAVTHVPGHFDQNDKGITGVFSIWAALYKLKMSVVQQLDQAAKASPIKGYLSDGSQTQEGFVAQGLKFVNRLGFSRQNLQGRT